MITLRHRVATNLHNGPMIAANFCKLAFIMGIQATFSTFCKYANLVQLISLTHRPEPGLSSDVCSCSGTVAGHFALQQLILPF